MSNTFSICIPNFNYEKYLDITLASVFNQTYKEFEVIVTDNASTDKSVDVIRAYEKKHPNLSYQVNPTNVGFAGNLDEAGRLATKEYMIMLSSDDVINADALDTYNRFITELKAGENHDFAFCSTFEKIDGNGQFLHLIGPSKFLWHDADIDPFLSNKMGFNVFKVRSGEMFKRCISRFANPFNFASACYMADTYKKCGGYGGSRAISPDKWFHWKLLEQTDYVYFLDKPLFGYRWHNNNQTAQQSREQVLKFWMDEYRTSFEVSGQMLNKAGVEASFVKQSFIDRSIVPYVLKNMLETDFAFARRIYAFGKACYPAHLRNNKYYFLVRLLLIFSWISQPVLMLNRAIKHYGR